MSGMSSVGANTSVSQPWFASAARSAKEQTSPTAVGADQTRGSGAADCGDATVDADSLESLNEQIKSSITTALQEAEESGDTRDYREIIQQAVDETLQENGIDPNALNTRMRGARSEQMPPGPPPGMAPPSGDAASATGAADASGGASTTEDATSAGGAEETKDQLIQLLEDLLAVLRNDAGDGDSLVGFLVDEQS